MKSKLHLTFILSIVIIICKAQDTILISSKVGNMIDSIEKVHYRLFPFYSSKIFIAAAFIRESDSTIMLEAKLRKDSVVKKKISQQEFEIMKTIINQISPIVIPQPPIKIKKDTLFVRSGLNKNVLYPTLFIIPVGAGITGNIERMILETRKNMFKSIWVKAYAGAYAYWGGSGQLYGLSLNSLSGTGNSHLELNLGLLCGYDKSDWQMALSEYNYFVSTYGPDEVDKPKIQDYVRFGPGLAVGYRYQAPGGHFVFRTGLGFPEVIYISIGSAFMKSKKKKK